MNALGICVKLRTRISGIQGARECDIRPKTSDYEWINSSTYSFVEFQFAALNHSRSIDRRDEKACCF
jgi:hypothetical protein